jgi:hypothetical protein
MCRECKICPWCKLQYKVFCRDMNEGRLCKNVICYRTLSGPRLTIQNDFFLLYIQLCQRHRFPRRYFIVGRQQCPGLVSDGKCLHIRMVSYTVLN